MTAERIAELRKLDDEEVDQRDMCEALDEIERLQREIEEDQKADDEIQDIDFEKHARTGEPHMTDTELDALDRRLAERLGWTGLPLVPLVSFNTEADYRYGTCEPGLPTMRSPITGRYEPIPRFSRDLNAAHLLGEWMKEMGHQLAYIQEVIRLLRDMPERIIGRFDTMQAPAQIRAQAALAVLEAHDGK